MLQLCGTEFNNCRIIYDKIDKDADEKVTEEELENWIKFVQSRYVRADTDRQWSEHNPDDSATLTWAVYKHKVYAFTEGSLVIMSINVVN